MSGTIAIVTGASRGLGAALARSLAGSARQLITVSRNVDPQTQQLAETSGCQHVHYGHDLSDVQHIEAAALGIFAQLDQTADQYLLINNAGSLGPVAQYDTLDDAHAISNTFNLNVTSAMLLTTALLRATRALGADVRVVNISSGAGRSPTAGWGVYCATKAALDMYTRVARLEAPHARLVSLAPGVIDTSMQATIRSGNTDDFPDLARFNTMNETGVLRSPQAVAENIIQYINSEHFASKELDDIRQYSQ